MKDEPPFNRPRKVTITEWRIVKNYTSSRIQGFICQDNKITFSNNIWHEFFKVEWSFIIYEHPSPCPCLSFRILLLHNSQKSNRGQYRHRRSMQWNRGHLKSKGVNASSLVSTPSWLITAGLSPPASCILAHRPDPNRGLQQSNENCASNCPAGDPGLAKKGSFHSPPFWLTRWLYKSP